MKDYLICLSNLIHALQGERGFSTLITREKNNNETRLDDYFAHSDVFIDELKTYVQQWQAESELKTDQLKLTADISLHLSKINERRDLIKKHQSSTSKIFDFYTFSLITPLIQLMSSFALRIKNLHPNAVSAFCFFIQWKEKVGLERLVLTRGFVEQNFNDSAYQERIEFLLNEQHYYEQSFLSLATLEQQEIINNSYEVPDFKILQQIHQELKLGSANQLIQKIKGKDWFDLISKKLDAMHILEYELILNLDKKHNLFTKDSIQDLNVEQRLVYKLPIFENMPAYEVNTIVNASETYQLPKNKLIMLENNIATHLHIVLIGWVKVFKKPLNSNKETTLQMLGNGSSIMESCIFSNTCLKASAKSVTDVLLFSIPTAVVKQQIANNNQFALNLLSNIANKTVTLSHELELIKTQPSDYRIGRFLLEILNQKKWLSNKLQLPYNKSLIASQLGMSREVFSRSLSQLAKKGAVIDKNTITLSDKFELCQYCDNSIIDKCINYGAKECTNKHDYSGKISTH